ncbi:MAG: 4-hydroxybutyrate CoA-transferase [Chloroflexi bacterium]|nr:4-hydroxybutyrate CoA-transferase [Chloroflexota bacterium]
MKVLFTPGREPRTLGKALAARRNLAGVEVLLPAPQHDFGWYQPEGPSPFSVTVGYPTDRARPLVDARRCDVHFYGLVPFQEMGDWDRPDVLFTEVSEPDSRGFCSFGNSVWNKPRMVRQAGLVIAEVNPKLIRTFGDNFVHASEIDFFVEHQFTGAQPGAESLAGRSKAGEAPAYLRAIARHVAQLLKDGDTLQIGVGHATEKLLQLGILDGRNDMGFHSEATPPGLIPLVQRGIVNGARKTLNPGRVVITSVGGGTAEDMAWVDQNPLFLVVDVEYLADIRVISAHDNMVAINSALMVDLTGQIAAETVGRRFLAHAGGQIVFAFGARLSKGGRAMTVLPATAGGGAHSRIVPEFPPGTVVTVQRNCADIVVTEFGVAHLRGKTVRQRARALVDIAHPDFRPALAKAADELYWP